MIKDEIKNLIETVISKGYSISNGRQKYGTEVLVEVPSDSAHGDYSTNIALVLSKVLQKSPPEIAKEIVSAIKNGEGPTSHNFEKIEVAGPGFINFYLSKDFFIESIKKIAKDKNVGKSHSLKNQKVIVEYTDPNPFKKIHIGHLMPNTIGESIARIYMFEGAKVKRVNYQGDVGIHVAKAIWAMRKGVDLLEAYASGHKAYEDDEIAKKEISEINKKIYDRSDREVNKLYDLGKKESLEYFERIYKKLETKFDHYFFESEMAEPGKKIVYDGLKKGVFEKGDKGAIIFKGEKFGLHTRVFINSEGLPTYEAKDLALSELKYNDFKYDKSIIVTANEQSSYFEVMLRVLKELKPELAEKTKHISHGLLRLPGGKMSSRAGTIIPVDTFIDNVKQKIKERIDKKITDTNLTQIAMGAIRYSILKQSIGSDIVFDLEKSVSIEGDSGPYLQYAYVRALSILKKASKEKIKPSFTMVPETMGNFEKMLCRFQEAIENAGKKYEPHYISLYLTELAASFNHYYAENKIVDVKDELSPYKVAVTQTFANIMENGLWLLGIPTPNKM